MPPWTVLIEARAQVDQDYVGVILDATAQDGGLARSSNTS